MHRRKRGAGESKQGSQCDKRRDKTSHDNPPTQYLGNRASRVRPARIRAGGALVNDARVTLPIDQFRLMGRPARGRLATLVGAPFALFRTCGTAPQDTALQAPAGRRRRAQRGWIPARNDTRKRPVAGPGWVHADGRRVLDRAGPRPSSPAETRTAIWGIVLAVGQGLRVVPALRVHEAR